MRNIGQKWLVLIHERSSHGTPAQKARCAAWLITLAPRQIDCLGEMLAQCANRIGQDYVQECGGIRRWWAMLRSELLRPEEITHDR